MKPKNLNIKQIFLSFFSGSALAFAFAPYNLWWLAYPCLAFLCYQIFKNKIKTASFYAFLFGLGFFGIGVSWVFISIHEYGNTNIPLAIFITSLFVTILALFPCIQAYCLKKTCGNNKSILIAFPASFVIFEWLRNFLWTGFPWLYIGYSQIDTPLAYIAPYLGVCGISFSSCILASCIVFYALNFKSIKRLLILICITIVIFIPSILLKTSQNLNSNDQSFKVALIQGNIRPYDKFVLENPLKVINEAYVKPTLKLPHDIDIIIWPENALPGDVKLFKPLLDKVINFAKQHNMLFLFGGITEISNEEYYNSLYMRGNSNGVYHKTRLVPFGEFLPLRNLLQGFINFFDIPMSNFSKGKDKQHAFISKKYKISPFICYEIAFPEEVRKDILKHKSNLIVTISEDGWFGKSMGPHQHLQITRMRALENGRTILRSTTSGISAIIDSNANVKASSSQFKQEVLIESFNLNSTNTLWTKFGQVPILLISLMLWLACLLNAIYISNKIKV